MKVLVVDDNPVIRRGLVAMLEELPEVEQVDTADNGMQAVRAVAALRYDLVFLDVRMPVMDGIAALEEISSIPVIMLTSSDDGEVVQEAIEKGAKGYLVNGEFTAEELISAVHTCVKGGSVWSPAAVASMSRSAAQSASNKRGFPVSEREAELLDALSEGLSNAQIARRLQISEKTVKNHLNRIFPKLGVLSRAEAIVLWISAKAPAKADANGPKR